MLSGYRALDLTDRKGFFCGKILGQLGVDVIKIERPGGDPDRLIGPFYHDTVDPEKSLYWFAYNESKRGITLNLEVPEGRKIFKRLVGSAHFVIESFPVGHLKSLGLDYNELSMINPGITVTSITPYGQTGKWKHWKGTDLTLMATGGIVSLTGQPDGIPTRLNPDHGLCVACMNGAVATLWAHHYRELSGEGQHVDVSIHECIIRENYIHTSAAGFEFSGLPLIKRAGGRARRHQGQLVRIAFPCKDGYVSWVFFGASVGAQDNLRMYKWLDDEGIPHEIPTDTDWDNVDMNKIGQDYVDKIEAPIMELFMKYTKDELEEEATRRGVRVYAMTDIKAIMKNRQLEFRKFFVDVDHSELGTTLKYPGSFFKTSAGDKANSRFRGPLIGEHNKEIYQDELGYTDKKLNSLKQAGVI